MGAVPQVHRRGVRVSKSYPYEEKCAYTGGEIMRLQADYAGRDNTEQEGGVLCIIRIVLYCCINTVVLFLRTIRGAGRNIIK